MEGLSDRERYDEASLSAHRSGSYDLILMKGPLADERQTSGLIGSVRT